MKKFLIFAPPFDENSGGVVVLHKLCATLNHLGFESYIYPYFLSLEVSRKQFLKSSFRLLKDALRSLAPYKTNPQFNTPVFYGAITDEFVVVYPEIVFGNPLNAKNIVRWLLHEPGYHTGDIYYGSGELYFRFGDFAREFSYPGSTISESSLTVVDFPLDIYNEKGTTPSMYRNGVAYCIRKGKGKLERHPMGQGFVIDGKNHDEVSRILKSVKTLISYDVATAYSWFAVLCGAESIVIPDHGVSKEQWRPDPQSRYGIAYGFDDWREANKTAHLLKGYIESLESNGVESVRSFVHQVNLFFTE